MSIESDLKKDGIKVIDKLDELVVNTIARNIAQKLVATFPQIHFDETNLYIKLSRIHMYTADMPNGMAEANYFYKNSSIYFNNQIDVQDLEDFAIHECIHHIQEIKDKNNKLLRMGLCTFTHLKPFGMGLNEAAVQYITSKVIGIKPDYVKYYGIDMRTSSPCYYPVECNLLEQINFLLGEESTLDSTFHSNNHFRNLFESTFSKKVYEAVVNSFDYILNCEEKIIIQNNLLQEIDEHTKKVDKIINQINILKEQISTTYMRTQNLIFTTYFDNTFNQISDLEGLDNFRRKLDEYRNYIGRANGYYYFDNYYTEKMCALEHKCNILENGGLETAIEKSSVNKIVAIFNKIKEFFFKECKYSE
ncbi:MAG: hypothetical protein HFJ47_00265 [Clostridia bacterium]|nr:hypothetical protein [Clostridia bacterium]